MWWALDFSLEFAFWKPRMHRLDCNYNCDFRDLYIKLKKPSFWPSKKEVNMWCQFPRWINTGKFALVRSRLREFESPIAWKAALSKGSPTKSPSTWIKAWHPAKILIDSLGAFFRSLSRSPEVFGIPHTPSNIILSDVNVPVLSKQQIDTCKFTSD